jgi:hypothetical protein
MALASLTTTTMTIQGPSESLPDECERSRATIRLATTLLLIENGWPK